MKFKYNEGQEVYIIHWTVKNNKWIGGIPEKVKVEKQRNGFVFEYPLNATWYYLKNKNNERISECEENIYSTETEAQIVIEHTLQREKN